MKLKNLILASLLAFNFNSAFSQAFGYTEVPSATSGLDISPVFGTSKMIDIDEDGYMDLFMAGNYTYGNSSITFRNLGDGTFSSISTGLPGCMYPAVDFGYINNNSDLYCYIQGRFNRNNQNFIEGKLFKKSANSTSFTEVNPASQFVGLEGGDVKFSDIDNDGDLDLITTGKNSNNFGVTIIYKNDGLGNFTTFYTLSQSQFYGSSILVEDLNGDGYKDYIFTGMQFGNGTAEISVYLNSNNNGTPVAVSSHNLTGVFDGDIEAGDFDRDGIVDVVITGNNRAINVYKGNGDGTFVYKYTFSSGTIRKSTVAVSDLNYDGELDIVYSCVIGALTVTKILKNNGDFNFQDTNTPLVGVARGKVLIHDWNNNGSLDLIICGATSDQENASVLKYYTNDLCADNIPLLLNQTSSCPVTLTPPTALFSCNNATITPTTTTTFPITSTTTVTWTYNNSGAIRERKQKVTISGSTFTPATATLPALTNACSITSLTAPTGSHSCYGNITATTTTQTPITQSGTIVWKYMHNGVEVGTQNQTVTISGGTFTPATATLPALTNACSITSLTAPTGSHSCYGNITATTTTQTPITQSTTVVWKYMHNGVQVGTQNQIVTINGGTFTPTTATLPALTGCSITSLTAPTGTHSCYGNITATTTTQTPITQSTTVVWKYMHNGVQVGTQNQIVTISTPTFTPTTATLPALTNACSITSLTAPTGTHSCYGNITATTTTQTPITQSTTVVWKYMYNGVEVGTQNQIVTISGGTFTPATATLPALTNACSITSLTAPTGSHSCYGNIIATTTTQTPITQSTTVVWKYMYNGVEVGTQNQTVTISGGAFTPTTATLPALTNACSITSLTAPTGSHSCYGNITATTTTQTPITQSGTVVWKYMYNGVEVGTQNQTVTISGGAFTPTTATLPALTTACSFAFLNGPTGSHSCFGTITATTTTQFPITQSTTVVWKYMHNGVEVGTQNQQLIISGGTFTPATANLGALTDACSITSLTAPTGSHSCYGAITATTTTQTPITQSGTIVWKYMYNGVEVGTQNQTVTIDGGTFTPATANLGALTDACSITSLTAPTGSHSCYGAITATTTTQTPITQSGTIVWKYMHNGVEVGTQNQTVTINNNIDTSVTVNNKTLTASQANATYEWTACNGNTVLATTQSFIPSSNGEYKVKITSAAGCSVVSACRFVDVTLSITESQKDAFVVYPNPTNGEITIETSTLDQPWVIFDGVGKVVKEGMILSEKTQVVLDELQYGVYYIKVGVNTVNKIVLQ